MKDDKKTKEQLIHELEDLRRRINKLERSEARGKRSEEALRESEEKYRLVVENVAESISIIQDGKQIFVNPGSVKILGYPPEVLTSKPFIEFIHPDDRGMVMERHNKRMSGEEAPPIYSFRVVRRDGVVRWVEANAVVVPWKGKPAALNFLNDITERKQAEEALLESEERYRDLVENSHDLICTHDLEGNLLSVNEAPVRTLGYSRESLLQMNPRDLLAPEQREKFEVYLKEIQEKGRASGILRVQTASGETRYWEYNNTLRTEGVVVPIVRGMAHDITEQRKVEQALRESEKKYRELYDFLPIPVYEMDLETNITSANRAIYRTFRGTEEDLKRGLKVGQIFSPEEAEKSSKNIKRLLKGGQIEGTEYNLKRLDGSVFPAIVVSSVIYSDDKPVGLRGAIVDITDRKRAEEALKESEERYRELFNNMTSGVAVYETKDNGNNFIIKDFNKGAEAIEQVKKEDILGKSIADVFPGVKEFGLFDVFQRVWKTGKSEHYPVKLYKDARIYGWRDNFVYKLPSGEIVAVYTDETQRKRAEEANEISLTKYQTLFEALPLGVTITDKAGNILESNKEAEKLLGLPRGAHTKRTVDGPEWRIIRPDGSPMPADEFPSVRALKGNRLIENVEMGIVKGEGEITWINVTAAPILLEDYGVVIAYTDITGRKQVEKEIEDLARFPQENPNPVLRVEPDGLIVYSNEASKPLLFDWNTAVGNYLPTSLCKLVVDTIASKRKITMDISCGELVFSIMFSPTSDNKYVNIYGRDVTERKKAEEALKASEERYRTIIETIEDGYYETDLAGNLTYFNDAMVRVHEYSREELLGMNNRQYTDAQNAKILFRHFNRVYNTGEPSKGIYYEIITKGGGKKNLEASVSLIRDSKGDILGFRGIVRDVTELRKAEKAVQTSEERFRVAAESANDFIYEWDLQSGRVNWFGKAVERLGDMLGELPDTNAVFVKEIYPEDLERITQATIRHLKQGDPHLEEYRLVGKDGDIIHVKSAGMCLRNEEGRGYKWIGALSDITERKRAEEELKQSFEKVHRTMGGIIQAMALTVESKDPYTAGHQQRVSALARSIAQEMGLPKDQVEAIRMAGLVHDLGKISVPAEILSKPTKLSDIEFSLIKGHSQTSYDILKDIEFPWPIAEIALQHHERLDGSGYPSSLKGDQILIEAQILMVADVVEAIASHRPYRPALGIEVALDEISKNKGKLYSTAAVDACLRLFTEKGYKF